MYHKLLTTFLLAYGLTIASIAQQKISKTFSGIERIVISTSAGDCLLKKSANAEVTVDLEHTYDEGYKPVIDQEGSRLVVKEIFDRGSVRGKGQWTFTIPDGLDIRYNTGSGDFEANDLSFELDMNTGSGDILLKQIRGEMRSNTGSGDIELRDVDGEFNFNTGSGDIRVEKANGDLRVNCGSGDITMKNAKAMISANTGSGSINASGITLAGESSFNSGSGDAVVTLQSSLQYDISVNSGSGDARVDFNGNAISGLVVMKASKKHGKITAPFTFDKEEEIKQGPRKNGQVMIKKTAQRGDSDVRIRISTGSGVASIEK